MATVLSTKKLSVSQKQLLLGAKIGLVEYNAIKIEFIPFSFNFKLVKNAIITSKNAFKAIQDKVKVEKAFVVGTKTANLLQENDIEITEVADNASALAKKIIENHQNKHFVFFCGNKRRDELQIQLNKNEISFEEIQVYKTKLNYAEFHQEFDGILFFSPSGVESYFSKNKIKTTTAFCIGTTTANSAKNYTENIIMATQPSIENVIVQVVKTFNKNEISNS
ncbi:uroporphyrinogen-III synthase [Zunongwangia sp. HGR-M22]|uniref:uroporphyrinogen-III synthase n=1 Tax=Zunongwangia sp. HGR-M22 TaxID=3015168 RepID=UPI0022DD704C|nr:uroporphyrinogen-III synthase [Zunongwangia sp. HGR-M22]WBL25598.1 uroporphyrinogen-III synthase [Zunongwangia sp. HGR-M22]